MGQLPVLLFEGIIDSILDMVDSAFGNNIDIDSICAMSAFATLYIMVDVICRLGEYVYRIEQEHFTECYVLQMLVTIGCTVIFAISSGWLPHLFQLTSRQRELLQACILAKCLHLPVSRTRSFLAQYTTLTCQSKCMIGSSIVFWSTAILTNIIVIILHGECYHLVIMTGFAELATVVFYFICAKLPFARPSIHVLRGKIKPALNELVGKIFGNLSLLIFSTLASRMGTEAFALHSVGYGIARSVSAITDCCSTVQLIQLRDFENIEDGYNECKYVVRRIAIPITLTVYAIALIMVPFMHGEVAMMGAFIATVLYVFECIPVQLYESRRGFLTRYAEMKPIRMCGVFSLCIRTLAGFISIVSGIGVIGFALCGFINAAVTGLYLDYKSKKLVGGLANGFKQCNTEITTALTELAETIEDLAESGK